jgi:urea transport system permease protein
VNSKPTKTSASLRLQGVLTKRGWVAYSILFLVGCVILPVLHLTLPAGSPLRIPDYLLAVIGKFFCYAMAAIAMDLLWGIAGILSLGQGVFFALGGYAMGMYLMLSMAGAGVYRSRLPDFMVFLDWKELPWFWRPFDNFAVALAAVVVGPGLLALTIGFFAFRSRIRGVYFSIITQAITYALMLLFFRNETGLGGNNGLTDFKSIYGYPFHAQGTKTALYVLSAAGTFLVFLLARFVTSSKAGRVLRAIRDQESRVLFTGYDAAHYKMFVFTLSAVICGIAGALYVPQVGIINPSELQPANSIEMAIWAAVGGRGTLFGAALGAFVVNGAKSWFTVALPEWWLYLLGALFIGVTIAFPRGLAGIFTRSRA